MANRSYIFITDNYKGDSIKAKGISEFSNNVPAVYLLLSAYNTLAIQSKLFKDEPAIIADFDNGKQLLIDVLAAIAAVYPDDDTLAEFSAITANFLGGLKAKYVLLENHEVYVLGENDYAEQNENMITMAGSFRVLAEDMVFRHNEGLLSHDTLTNADTIIINKIAGELDELEEVADFWTDGKYQNLSDVDMESNDE